MTVGDLETRMSAQELIEWRAYDRIDPVGDRRADLRSGFIAAALLNINRSKETVEAGVSYSPEDFLLEWREPPARERVSGETLRRQFMSMRPPKK